MKSGHRIMPDTRPQAVRGAVLAVAAPAPLSVLRRAALRCVRAGPQGDGAQVEGRDPGTIDCGHR